MIKVILKKFIVLILLVFGPAALPAADRPNIVIILADDAGFSDLGCFGGEIETPNLDSLAAKGLRFTEFYNMARCWPSRVALMTGSYDNYLNKNRITIPQVLKTAGYNTAMVGNGTGGHTFDPNGPNAPINRGFDDFYGTLHGAGSYYDPMTLTRNRKSIESDNESFYYTDKIGEEAVRQIKALAKAEKPFFQYVAFTAPHWPIHAPEKTIQKYQTIRGWLGETARREVRVCSRWGSLIKSASLCRRWSRTSSHGTRWFISPGTSATWPSMPRWLTIWITLSVKSLML